MNALAFGGRFGTLGGIMKHLNHRAFIACLIAAPLALSTMAVAKPLDRATCLAKAEEAPDFALAEAQRWQRDGGGDDAALCQAMALLLMGEYEQAAKRLDALVPTLTMKPASKAGLWARAGLAWDKAKQPDRADHAYGQALALTPDDVDLLVDRALSRAGAERYWDAVADLDRAVALAPERAEILVLRATAKRRLAQDGPAADDVEAALKLDPNQPDALLLRGVMRADRGDTEGAKADWIRVRQLTGDKAQGRTAAANLEALEKQGG
jgi:tetratricopeptide (TPR) repeat protein